MNNSSTEMRNQANLRCASYAFLAWLFLEQLDSDFITQLLADEVQDSIRLLASEDPSGSKMNDGLHEMMSFVTAKGSWTVEEVCQALNVERSMLLGGISRSYGPPPPYESLYRSDKLVSETSVLVDVAKFYREVQVELPKQPVDRIDYLGLELDLMRLLCEEERRCWELGETVAVGDFRILQQRFLREHLLCWAPNFCETMLSHATNGFYQGVSQLLLGFLESEAMILAMSPAEDQSLSRLKQTGYRKVM